MSSTPEQRTTGRLDGDERATSIHDVHAAEKERFGGIKFGSAFFGWLTAMGMAVILTAVLAAAGGAVGVATGTDAAEASNAAGQDPATIGTAGAAVLAIILFVAYYCGGYVAARMARFNGAKQGFAVWLWALLIAVLVAVVGTVAGAKYNVLQQVNSFPRIPVGEGDLTTAGVIALVLVVITTLLGAIVGGAAGMRYHRRVDRTAVDGF